MSPFLAKDGSLRKSGPRGSADAGDDASRPSSSDGPDGDRLGVVVVAAGSSTRMRGVDKVFADLAGKPVLAWSLGVFDNDDRVVAIAVVLSDANFESGKQAISLMGLKKVTAVVRGGQRRQDSVLLGLEALIATKGGYKFIAIHDGARPFIDSDLIGRGLAAAKTTGAAVAAVLIKDTVKILGLDGMVVSTPDRSSLRAIQTPQFFRADIIYTAHKRVMKDVTDDASMVEVTGGKVAVFEGIAENLKVTTPEDLALARPVASRRTGGALIAWSEQSSGGASPTGARFGIGFDGHRLEHPGPLRLGGTDIPFDMHLAGHSDGDVLLHAVCNALLGAASLGDMGRHFPSDDPRYAGIDSTELLRQVVSMVASSGWLTDHVDATIITQRPRLAATTPAMAQVIASIVGVPPANVNIKVTSTDTVGAIGEGLGIAAQAITVIRRI